MNFDDLKQQKRWVCYYTVENKKPMDARRGTDAKSTDPSTWSTYDEAVAGAKRFRFAGVGFVVHDDDDICGIDLDECLTPVTTEDGEAAFKRSAFASHIMSLAPSYTELSPGGDGLHIIGFGQMHRGVNTKIKGDKVEQYATGRYFTYTGNHIEGTPTEFASIQDAINEIYDLIEDEKTKSFSKLASIAIPSTSSDDEHLAFVYQTWVDRAVDMMRNAYVGNRHTTRVKAGRLLGGALAALRGAGYPTMSDDEAIRMLYDVLEPDQGEQRVEWRAIEDGLNYGLTAPLEIWERRKPIEPPPPMTVPTTSPAIEIDVPAEKREYHLTDLGNGQRMVDATSGRLCYVDAWKQWLVWDGHRWARGEDAGVSMLAHKVALSIYDDISSQPDDKRKDFVKWAMASESSQRIDAMIKTARPYLTKSHSLFDTHAHLLTVTNGTLNLRNGQLREASAADMLTKMVPIAYDATAKCPKWTAFLRKIFDGNGDLIEFIQRAVGYALTGSVDEHCLFFLYGTGANGKSTFLEVLRMLMGEYYVTTSIEAMLALDAHGGGATPYVAAMAGMRMAMASEMPEGRRFNESLIKDITGGGTISARHLYGAPFEFQPSHTMWISGNHKPRITGTDEGIWRRIRMVPFTVTIPEHERRPMTEILEEFRAELPGILAWAVNGAIAWYDWGLPRSETIEKATMEYRGEEDIVARFIAEECVMAKDASIVKHKLFSAWQEWTEHESEKAASNWSQRRFTEQLKRKNIELGGMGRMLYIGITLRSDREADK
jgi:putative DNA primase/helicase